jgi:hypothetical protein
LILAAGIASLKKQIPALRRVSVRVHRGLAIAGLVLALFHLVLGLSVYL